MINHQDIIKRATDNILSAIGPENVKLFLKMDELTGKTRDLLKPDLTFSANGGVTYKELGPFGRCMRFNGSTGYLRQDPVTEATLGDGYTYLMDGSYKRAQKMVAVSTKVGFATLKLIRVGNLPAATIRVSIYTDVAGVPGAPVANGTSDVLACSAIGTASSEDKGFSFSAPPSLQKNQQYWIVLEYVNNTGVDGANHVGWYVDTIFRYGQPRSFYDGAVWSTYAVNQAFGLWSDDLALDTDGSLILLAKLGILSPGGSHSYLAYSASMLGNSVLIRAETYGDVAFVFRDTGDRKIALYRWPAMFHCYGGTFSKSKSVGKGTLYYDGAIVSTVDGDGNTSIQRQAQPFSIGCAIPYYGPTEFANALIGPVIITKNELSPEAMGVITSELLALRKYRVAV